MQSPFRPLSIGQTGIMTGFTLQGSPSEKPLVVDVTIETDAECTRNGLTVQEKQFCVSVAEGYFPCGGDVGGGVLFKEGSVYVLKVFTSFPSMCTIFELLVCTELQHQQTPERPNVDEHSDWILDTLEANA